MWNGRYGGVQLWKIYLPFYLGLLFPSPLLFPSCSILIPLPVVSPHCGVLPVEGARLLYSLRPSHGTLAVTGFWLGQFQPLPTESGYWGGSPFTQICQAPPCFSVLSPAEILVVCPDQLGICNLWATLSSSLMQMLSLGFWLGYVVTPFLCESLGRLKIVLPLQPPLYQNLLRVIF